MLSTLAAQLQQSLGILHKQDIQTAARVLGMRSADILLGDDCAAIPDAEGYLLLAAEGLLPMLVEAEPWFAGWCAIMVNVSDIYGRSSDRSCRHSLESVCQRYDTTLGRNAGSSAGLPSADRRRTYQLP
jgi:hypothetical protein